MKKSHKRKSLNMSKHITRLRLLNFTLLFGLVGVLLLLFAGAAPLPGMYGSVEQDQVNRINHERWLNGRGGLQHIECLNTVAERWTERMVAAGGISHNPSLASDINNTQNGGCGSGWAKLGENVGVGYSSESVFNAFMNSPGHKVNILDSAFNKTGVGAYWSPDGKLYITQVFASCSSSCNPAWHTNATLPADPVTKSPPPPPVAKLNDYNGDGKADIAMWRPSDGKWYVRGIVTKEWGRQGDIPVPGDYNGDGKSDFAIFRPAEKNWYIYGMSTVGWGEPGDIPPNPYAILSEFHL
jgi:hypothetical protein